MFNRLFALNDIGLTLAEYGRIMAIGAFVGVAVCLPMEYLIDRFHPLRVYLVGAILVIAATRSASGSCTTTRRFPGWKSSFRSSR